jgi:hypothetical protein
MVSVSVAGWLAGDCLVLDADRMPVEFRVAGVPGVVLLPHHLCDPAVARNDVMSADPFRGFLESPDGAGGGALGGVDNDIRDRNAEEQAL